MAYDSQNTKVFGLEPSKPEELNYTCNMVLLFKTRVSFTVHNFWHYPLRFNSHSNSLRHQRALLLFIVVGNFTRDDQLGGHGFLVVHLNGLLFIVVGNLVRVNVLRGYLGFLLFIVVVGNLV